MSDRCWLMKTEPETFGFAHLMSRPNRTEPWDGVRNYTARNLMRDEMAVGDDVFIYHSRSAPPHVAGIARVAGPARPDPSQFDPTSKYFDPKATPAAPRWVLVDVQAVAWLERPVTLPELKALPAFADMMVVKKGQRLSIQPVGRVHFDALIALSQQPPAS